MASLSANALSDYLIAQGRYTFTAEEATMITGWKEVRSGLARLAKAGKLFSPYKGFYVIVPPEYRSWGAVPAEWFIDTLMNHLNVPYYVGLLSAAAMHGASHQAPQVFQVVTGRQLRARNRGRIRLRFLYSDHIAKTPVVRKTVHTGSILVSSKEATLFDLIAHPAAAIGFGNIATVIRDLGELDGSQLAAIAKTRPRVHARRVGWLLEQFDPNVQPVVTSSGQESSRIESSPAPVDLEPLRLVASPGQGRPLPLDGREARRGPVDQGWGLIINTEVQPDI
ncbi:MAG: type IV toxin-antitoxin system AbiEi family antitoxin domain-containing protein [Candidatus Dormibacteraceae bacterium]